MAKIRIIGAGSFGVSLAINAFQGGHEVIVWDISEKLVEEILRDGEQKYKLPGVKIPSGIGFTSDPASLDDAQMVVFAVPSPYIRGCAEQIQAHIHPEMILVSVAKGLEAQSFMTMSQVIASVYPDNPIGVITGPSHAEELGRGIPTTVCAASKDLKTAQMIQEYFTSKCLRLYVNLDPVGCELGGALKNIIALAAGICDGLKCGDNTKAALITRGIHEMTKLGVAMGGKTQTFSGLSGIGDLIVTCCSMHSRNRRAGLLIGEGTDPKKAVEQVGTVEGYDCCRAAYQLSRKYNISMPITEQLYQILFMGAPVSDAIHALMNRPNRMEYDYMMPEESGQTD